VEYLPRQPLDAIIGFFDNDLMHAKSLLRIMSIKKLSRNLALAVPIRDEKMIIWNFMEEFWSKYQETKANGGDLRFHLAEFRHIDVFEKYLPVVGIPKSQADGAILDILNQYGKRGLYKIDNDIVSLTDKGLNECRKPIHNWG